MNNTEDDKHKQWRMASPLYDIERITFDICPLTASYLSTNYGDAYNLMYLFMRSIIASIGK